MVFCSLLLFLCSYVLGGFECETKRIFIVSVANRNRETLLAAIKKWILPGTTVVSDRWEAYSNLSSPKDTNILPNSGLLPVNSTHPSGVSINDYFERWLIVGYGSPRG